MKQQLFERLAFADQHRIRQPISAIAFGKVLVMMLQPTKWLKHYIKLCCEM
jgi:hypothetical protein